MKQPKPSLKIFMKTIQIILKVFAIPMTLKVFS